MVKQQTKKPVSASTLVRIDAYVPQGLVEYRNQQKWTNKELVERLLESYAQRIEFTPEEERMIEKASLSGGVSRTRFIHQAVVDLSRRIVSGRRKNPELNKNRQRADSSFKKALDLMMADNEKKKHWWEKTRIIKGSLTKFCQEHGKELGFQVINYAVLRRGFEHYAQEIEAHNKKHAPEEEHNRKAANEKRARRLAAKKKGKGRASV